MTRLKFALNQNNDYATIKGKKYILDADVYNHLKRIRNVVVTTLILGSVILYKFVKKAKQPMHLWIPGIFLFIFAVAIILNIVLLPKDLDNYIKLEESSNENSEK